MWISMPAATFDIAISVLSLENVLWMHVYTCNEDTWCHNRFILNWEIAIYLIDLNRHTIPFWYVVDRRNDRSLFINAKTNTPIKTRNKEVVVIEMCMTMILGLAVLWVMTFCFVFKERAKQPLKTAVMFNCINVYSANCQVQFLIPETKWTGA